MDGFAPLTHRRRARAAVLVAALLLTACGSGVQDASPSRTTGEIIPLASEAAAVFSKYEVSAAETMGLEEGLKRLDAPDDEVIHIAMDYEPTVDGLPSHAISWAGYEMEQKAKLIVANFWPTELRLNVICLVDGEQVPCSNAAGVWRVELDEPGMAILDLPEAEVEGRRDVLMLEESDERVERVYPISGVRNIDGYDAPFSTLGDPLPEIVNPLGGCGWALLMDDLEPRDTFKPLRAAGASPVHLVMSICPEHSAYELFPVFIVDETAAAQIEGLHPFVVQPGAAYAWELPSELLAAGDKIRATVIHRGPGGGHWVTHPLVTARVPG